MLAPWKRIAAPIPCCPRVPASDPEPSLQPKDEQRSRQGPPNTRVKMGPSAQLEPRLGRAVATRPGRTQNSLHCNQGASASRLAGFNSLGRQATRGADVKNSALTLS